MSQKNGLNIHVIKTKRIQCAKLDLPAMLAQPRKTPTQNDRFTTPRPKASSLQTSNHNPSEVNLRRQTDSRSSLTDSLSPNTNDVPNTLEADEDVVFEDSLETPSEAFAKPIKRGARCLSLPACLGAESEGDDERSVCLRPRRLFEEALNLERSRSAPPRGTSPHGAGGASDEVARGRETAGRQGAAEDKEVKRRRTWRAEIVREKEALELIADHNNNNSSLREQECVPNYIATRSQSASDLRRDWEQKILGLTESGSEFGTERGGASYEDEGRRTRPRSVTLAGSVHAFVEAREKAKAREAKGRAKSVGKHRGMPKFQTVVWDYIKRRSSKRKVKGDRGTKEDSSKPKHSTNEDSASCFPPVEQLKKDTTSVASGDGVSRRSTVSEIPQSPSLNSDEASPSLNSRGKWKSTPNLALSEATEYAERILERKNSWDELDSRTDRAKTPVKELQEEPEILRLLLTTNSELRPMEERLKTLALAREWLVKELNVMREEDRRLARQFINSRSAIMEIKRARETEDSDCESDGEERKSKRNDSKRLAAEQERHINDHGHHMHVTPTRNILSYC